MPDDSCRTCGGELVKHSRCSECRKIIQRICTSCNLKTHKEFHPKCLRLDMYQINRENAYAYTQNMIYKTPEIRRNKKKNISNKTLIISGVIVIIISALAFGNYLIPTLSHDQSSKISNNEMQYIGSKNQIQYLSAVSNQNLETIPNGSFKAQYANCLGTSDGNSLAINCPTDYGVVYKAIVKIPDELILQFENKVFHMRNFSVLENSNDLLIEYQKQTYVTTFIVN